MTFNVRSCSRFNASGILANDPADEKNPLESFLADSRETIDLGDLKSFRQQKLAQHNVDESNRTVDDDYHDLVEVQPEEVRLDFVEFELRSTVD